MIQPLNHDEILKDGAKGEPFIFRCKMLIHLCYSFKRAKIKN